MIRNGSTDWVRDVDRANNQALAAWEEVLDGLDRILSEPWDRSAAALRRNIPRWTAAVAAADSASKRLHSGLNLSRARLEDARRSGFTATVDASILDRARLASDKAEELGCEIRRRMDSISDDLQSRRPRRSRHTLFQSNAPSLVDIHV